MKVCSITRSKVKIKVKEPLKFGNSAIFKGYLLPHLQWGLTNGHAVLNYGTIPKDYRGRISIFGLVFVSRDFEVGRNVTCEESTVSPVRG